MAGTPAHEHAADTHTEDRPLPLATTTARAGEGAAVRLEARAYERWRETTRRRRVNADASQARRPAKVPSARPSLPACE